MADPSYDTMELVASFCMGARRSMIDSEGRKYDITAIRAPRGLYIELDRLGPDGPWVTVFTAATVYEVAVEVERLGLREVPRRFLGESIMLDKYDAYTMLLVAFIVGGAAIGNYFATEQAQRHRVQWEELKRRCPEVTAPTK